ncbi:MAG: type IX secretion system membrane protein PorP/SprF [Sphingobacteriaceae bacterium]|jgi:type IX secretion system PorP/SprF family membrane protein
MKRFITILFLLVYASLIKAQQDPQYNLYQFNPLVINPAYAGARDGLSGAANVRNQWVGFDGAPKTSVLSVHSPILNKNIGLGLTVLSDKIGPRNMIGVAGNFAYILKLNEKWKLSFGLSAGYNRFQFNYNQLTFKTMDNTSVGVNDLSRGALDFNSGIYLRTNTFFFGFSATHMYAKQLFKIDLKDTSSVANQLSYRLHTHNFMYIGKSFMLNENVIFSPTILFRTVRKGSANMDVNFNFFLYKKVWLGVFLRGPYGPGFLVNYYVNNKFKVGYSYDTGFKNAKMLGASHEVSIGFDLSGNKSKIISPRFL